METIGSSAGFEIVRDGDMVWLAARGTRGPAVAAWIAGGLTLLAVVNGAVWSVKLILEGQIGTGLAAAGALLGLSMFLSLVAYASYRVYRRRRDAPATELAPYRANLASGKLERGDGALLAELSAVAIDTPFNLGDSTQGAMRWVRIKWSGGSARVYNANKSEARRLAQALVDLGIGQLAD